MPADAAADFAAGALVEFSVQDALAGAVAAAVDGEGVGAGSGVGLLGEVGDEFGHHAADGRVNVAAEIGVEQAAVEL